METKVWICNDCGDTISTVLEGSPSPTAVGQHRECATTDGLHTWELANHPDPWEKDKIAAATEEAYEKGKADAGAFFKRTIIENKNSLHYFIVGFSQGVKAMKDFVSEALNNQQTGF